MIVFCLPQHRALLPAELDAASEPALGRCRLGRFSDGELWVELDDPVTGRDCAVLGSLAPPDEQMLATLLLAHTLRRAGARRVILVAPYLGYARQDRAPPGRSLGAAWAGALLQAADVEEVMTIDVHSADAKACFPVPVTSLSPAGLFAAELQHGSLEGLTLVAPDEGARDRCAAVAAAAGVAAPVAYLRKQRTAEGVVHHALTGEVGSRAVLVDDILDTGGTLLSACAELQRAGAREISVMVTHGTLSGERWRELPSAGVRRIQVTDTVPGVRDRGRDVLEVLQIAPLLMEALAPAAPGLTPHLTGRRRGGV
jgi:ribose-phosphate pyrophosphokinase